MKVAECAKVENRDAAIKADVFFSNDVARQRIAKAICEQCAVVDQCLADALRNGEQNGVWGGLDSSERKRLVARRHNRAASAETTSRAL